MLKTQLEDLIKHNKERNQCMNALKQQMRKKEDVLTALRRCLKHETSGGSQKRNDPDESVKKWKERCTSKDAQYKEMEIKCVLLSQNLVSTNSKLALQQKELEKLKLDLDIMDKSILDSVKTRQLLKNQATCMERDLQEVKMNPLLRLKLQETQKALNAANGRLEEMHRQLQAEKKTASFLIKEKVQLLKERMNKYKVKDAQKGSLEGAVAALRKMLSQKTTQLRIATEECRRLREEVRQTKEDMEKAEAEMKGREEAFKTRQCEYCGF